MVRLGSKESRAPLVHFFVLVLVLAFSGTTVVPCDGVNFHVYKISDLVALQALWGAWNVSTPQLESNLAGWNSAQPYPCFQEIDVNRSPIWRGVQCLSKVACEITNNSTGAWNCSSYIIGLSLENASIAGTLPPDIGNITTLTILELTGNPNLVGFLPDTLNNTNLYILDLHDNGFYGEIPDFGDFLWPLTMDLSGNKFSGSFPYRQIRSMVFLQKLNLGRNAFEGEVPERAFDNMTQLVQLDLSSNRFNGTLPNLRTIKNLQILDLSHNKFTGPLPDFRSMQSLHNVNLSRNELTGSVTISSFFNRSANNSLSVLDLSHNQLTTDLSAWNESELGSLQEVYLDNTLINGTLDLTRLSAMLNKKSTNSTGLLRILSLMNNSISNVIYNANHIEDVTTIIRLQGNPFCGAPDSDDGTRCFCEQICFSVSGAIKDSKRKVVIIAVVISVTSALILLLSVAALLHRNRRYKRYLQLQVQEKFEEFEVKPTIFPYNQLRTATRDFHPDLKLGEGAFGTVYKGILPNGNVVAVKQLFAETTRGIDEFLNEVVLLTGMKHRNLVNLKGCCIRDQQRLLVYEYVDNYDVDQVLLGAQKTILSWPVRLKMCLGVARGLHYLHALAHPRIIHRDIKASNILLAENYDTKIADFGLALLFPDEESYILTKHIAGTKGYMAPEYASYGQLSDKVDVFSFGVLCLEVVSGRRNIDETCLPDEMYLSKWAWDLHRRDNLMNLVDPHMSLEDEEKSKVHRLINIALLCIQNEADERPSMERVVAMLQEEGEGEVVPLKVGYEERYLDSIRLFAFGKGGLSTVIEEGDLSFLDSSRQLGGQLEDHDSSSVGVLELSGVKVR